MKGLDIVPETVILLGLIIFFSINMGSSNFGSSFAAACGSGFLKKNAARLLYTLFIIIGALAVGEPVAKTLGERIIPQELMTVNALIIIFLSASLSIFFSNWFSVPQSTSLVTVFALWGVGSYHGQVRIDTLFFLVPCWIFLPLTGFILTYFIGKIFYPPGRKNIWIYEKLAIHQGRLKIFVIAASCYNAFSIGTNNVANVAGPVAGVEHLSPLLTLLIAAPLFGAGSFLFSGTLELTSKKIVPLGPFTATVVCFITGTLIIIASALGMPQSFVMINMAAIFAISSLKKGKRKTFDDPSTRRTYYSWIIAPFFSFAVSFVATALLDRFFL